MLDIYFTDTKTVTKIIPIIPIETTKFAVWMQTQASVVQNWVNACNFTAKTATHCLLPDEFGNVQMVLLGVSNAEDFWSYGILPGKLKNGNYQIVAENWTQNQVQHAIIAWGLGSYKFLRYKKSDGTECPHLQIPHNCDQDYINRIINAIYKVRDLINTPAEDLTPIALAAVARQMLGDFTSDVAEIVGDDLLRDNFPAVHLVGRGSTNLPRIVDIRWGNTGHPKLTLVGKGVCFDSGGLDLKSSAGMAMMKKDMAGAAHVLGLAQLIMQYQLPVRLHVVVPIVENLVSGSSYKPGDVVKTRKGITVEITNTDAEGRVILADALAYACEDEPELIVDIATLTGAAKVALGTEVTPFFTPNSNLANDIIAACNSEGEPAWQLPLFAGYKDLLDSKLADIANCSSSSYGGAITAALFLQEFVTPKTEWIHFDIMGANVTDKPGRPVGGEAMCLRGLFAYLQKRFANR